MNTQRLWALVGVLWLIPSMALPAPEPIAREISVGGMTIDSAAPSAGLVIRRELGVICAEQLTGRVLHRAGNGQRVLETRAVVTPGGDLLVMFPCGKHYGGQKKKVNDMLAYRSKDGGRNWAGPRVAFDIDYNQHGFVPLVPRDSKQIYAFGTQPVKGRFNGIENAAIGFRWSDDDGLTWSDVTLIEPTNDPGFLGMSVMRMCETGRGTWLLGTHTGIKFFKTQDGSKTTKTAQYILRSEDRGHTWRLLPDKRPNGWKEVQRDRLEEGRPIALGDGRVLVHLRTARGHLWETRSDDDGKTWSEPCPTTLVHPLAPPMTFHLSDGKTLTAFHHNRVTGGPFFPHNHRNRSEIWVSLSTDEGRTWSEPRFVFANAMPTTQRTADHQCSYLDMVASDGELHMFVPHRWSRALYLRMEKSDLIELPTTKQLHESITVQ